MRRLAVVLALVASASVAGCGGSGVVQPVEVAQNYVSAIADGYYPGACSLLDASVRAAMVASTGSHLACAALLAHCLPTRANVSTDQSQLLYVNTTSVAHGQRARVTLSGLPVARAIRRVTLADERNGWLLTSPGVAVTRCARRLRRHARHRAHRSHR